MSEPDKPCPESEQEKPSPEQSPSYKVGFGKPPQSGQFTKGRSGNPKGRPKGSGNLASVVMRESRQRVRVNGPGRSRTVTKLEACLTQLANKAAQGDLRAARELFALIRMAEERTNSDSTPTVPHEMDHKVMENILRRMENFRPRTSSNKSESAKET